MKLTHTTALAALVLSTSGAIATPVELGPRQLDLVTAAGSSQSQGIPVTNGGKGKPAKVTGVKGSSCKCGKGSTVKVK